VTDVQNIRGDFIFIFEYRVFGGFHVAVRPLQLFTTSVLDGPKLCVQLTISGSAK
jgi:hypothetical protein